jgi:hypothetical protein
VAGQAFTQWQYLGSNGVQGTVQAEGPPQPFFRDRLDEVRSMWRRTPDAEYPDGYLGTITSRRGDRLLDSLKNRINERSYQRGVHKGTRIDPSDYFWPAEFNDRTGLEMEAKGRKFAPVGKQLPTHLVNAGKTMPINEQVAMVSLDPKRVSQLRALRPGWS